MKFVATIILKAPDVIFRLTQLRLNPTSFPLLIRFVYQRNANWIY